MDASRFGRLSYTQGRGSRFTLVELLVIVAIIAVLASILLPALARARFAAKRSACLAQTRQWGVAAALFGGDYDQRVPRGIDRWADTREPAIYAHLPGHGSIESGAFSGIIQRAVGWYAPGNPGGIYNTGTRVTATGSLIVLGYLGSDPKVWYCTDQTIDESFADEDMRSFYSMNRPRWQWNSNRSQARVDDLLDGDASFYIRHGNYPHKAGYASFLWVAPAISPHAGGGSIYGGISEAHPYGHDSIPYLKFHRLADNAHRRNWSPMIFACANDTLHQSHAFGPGPQGVNGAFYDGSSRWVSFEEAARLASMTSGNLRTALEIDNGSGLGIMDRTRLLENSYHTSHWSGRGYKLQLIARENLTMTGK